jgi:hypothetical protein
MQIISNKVTLDRVWIQRDMWHCRNLFRLKLASPVEILLSLRFEKLFPTSTRKQTLWSRAFFDAELHTLSLRRWLQGKICVTYLAAAKLHPVASKAEARLDSELTDFSCWAHHWKLKGLWRWDYGTCGWSAASCISCSCLSFQQNHRKYGFLYSKRLTFPFNGFILLHRMMPYDA